MNDVVYMDEKRRYKRLPLEQLSHVYQSEHVSKYGVWVLELLHRDSDLNPYWQSEGRYLYKETDQNMAEVLHRMSQQPEPSDEQCQEAAQKVIDVVVSDSLLSVESVEALGGTRTYVFLWSERAKERLAAVIKEAMRQS